MSSGSKKPQRRFQFIDNTNVSSMGVNSTQVRRHVMQEYMREKRWEARSKSDTVQGFEQQLREKPDKPRTRTQLSQKRSRSDALLDADSRQSDSDKFFRTTSTDEE